MPTVAGPVDKPQQGWVSPKRVTVDGACIHVDVGTGHWPGGQQASIGYAIKWR